MSQLQQENRFPSCFKPSAACFKALLAVRRACAWTDALSEASPPTTTSAVKDAPALPVSAVEAVTGPSVRVLPAYDSPASAADWFDAAVAALTSASLRDDVPADAATAPTAKAAFAEAAAALCLFAALAAARMLWALSRSSCGYATLYGHV